MKLSTDRMPIILGIGIDILQDSISLSTAVAKSHNCSNNTEICNHEINTHSILCLTSKHKNSRQGRNEIDASFTLHTYSVALL